MTFYDNCSKPLKGICNVSNQNRFYQFHALAHIFLHPEAFFYFLIQNDAPPVWSTVCGYMEINEKKIEKKEQALFMEMYT